MPQLKHRPAYYPRKNAGRTYFSRESTPLKGNVWSFTWSQSSKTHQDPDRKRGLTTEHLTV
ncbi:hypothetical protein NC652_040284 [Populus alba x Populus x berolinensis]|nr:hypothetical protein NC652_040284 [Populus alba x Populus x berolinensis]